MSNGHLKAFTADKGEQLLDLAMPLNSGTGPPMTFMLDGKQYIAVFAGTGQMGFGRGPGRGAAPGAPGRGPVAPQEPTAAAAAAQSGNTAPPPAPVTPVVNNNPKLFVYAVPN
jgi:hypothetical protein